MKTFEDELLLLLTQRGSSIRRSGFNLDTHHFRHSRLRRQLLLDFKENLVQSTNSYERPQCSACFIQSVNDALMSMFNLIKNGRAS
jgi:hypothetical protein